MAQDFWASSGFRLLARDVRGLHVTDAWLAHQLAREELAPPDEAGPVERTLHGRLIAAPRATESPSAQSAVMRGYSVSRK